MTPTEIAAAVSARMIERIIDHAAAVGIQKGSLTTGIRRATLDIERFFKDQDPALPEREPERASPAESANPPDNPKRARKK